MNALAVDWTAVGSIAGGIGAIAAFLAIVATVAVYLSQSKGDKAAAIRQGVQFIHGQQIQVVPAIESGLLALIDRQIREFRERLGPVATPQYFLDKLFYDDEASCDRSLFRASAQDSNLSSTTYSRMNDIWDGMKVKSLEFRGAFRIFPYACEALARECRRLCDPEFTTKLLKLARRNARPPTIGEFNTNPGRAIGTLTNHLAPELPEAYRRELGDVLSRWHLLPADVRVTGVTHQGKESPAVE
jgi:hypothetical protein